MPTPQENSAPDVAAAREAWNEVAVGWQRWWATIEAGARAVSVRLLELADVAPEQRVLDVATGLGEPALTAAQRVGPTGRVLATDLSPQMLAIARTRAAALGLSHIAFHEADAARVPVAAAPFDAILCRWGITSLPAPAHTLRALRGLLTATGAFATAVWESGPTGRPLAHLATALAVELFDSPSAIADAETPDASGQPALADLLREAGFTAVHTEVMTIRFEWPSVADCAQYLRDVSPDLRARVAAQSATRQAAYWRELADRLAPYLTAEGSVQISNVTICAVGRR